MKGRKAAVKPLSDGFSTLDLDAYRKKQEEEDMKPWTEKISLSSLSGYDIPQILGPEAKEKIAKVEELEKENSSLIQQNQDLTDKLGDYLIEIEELKSKQNSREEDSSLKSELDRCILKISQLNLENEQLKRQLEDLKSNKINVQAKQQQQQAQTTTRVMPVMQQGQQIRNNPASSIRYGFSGGYSSWN